MHLKTKLGSPSPKLIYIYIFEGLIWPLRGLTQKGQGATSVGASSPWPSSSRFFEFHQKKKVKKLEKSPRADLKRGVTSLTENLATPHKITYKIVRPPPLPENLKKKKKRKNQPSTYLPTESGAW
jgi:hypothetical protein